MPGKRRRGPEPDAQAGQEAVSEKTRSLRSNFAWTLAGNVTYAGCQWAMAMLLAKMGTPAMVGQFALGFAITTPVILFAGLQLRGLQATDTRHEYFFGHYLGLRLAATALAVATVLGFVLASGYRPETALVVLCVGIAKTFEAVSDVFHGLLQRHHWMERIARSQILKGPLSLAALGAVLYATGNLALAVLALAGVWCLVLALYDIPSGRRVLQETGRADAGDTVWPRWEMRRLAQLAWLALPLGVVMALLSLYSSVPRYFIERHLGEHSLGIFSAIAYLMITGTTIINALGQAATPRLAEYYAGRHLRAFCSLILKLVVMGVALGIAGVAVAVVAGRPLLSALYRPEYAAHSDVLVLLMGAAGIMYVASPLGFGMTAARCLKAQVPLFAAVTVASIAASALLIPRGGLHGAAWALVIAAAVQAAGSLLILLRALLAARREPKAWVVRYGT